jgi:hypothetical protein
MVFDASALYAKKIGKVLENLGVTIDNFKKMFGK